MHDHHKIKITLVILSLLLLTACAQTETSPANSPISTLPAGAPTQVVVRILNLDLAPIASPTANLPTATPLPTLAPPPTSPPVSAEASSASTSTPSCTNKAEFIKNLAVSDNTAFKQGQAFAKIWQIKNSGTCVWTTDYSLVYASGESMGSPASMPLPNAVNPGETIDLRLNLIAPTDPNTYSGNWYLQDASGIIFGLGSDGAQPLGLTIVVRPPGNPPT